MPKMTKKTIPDKRRVAFKKALLDEGMTVTAFAKVIGVHRVHLMSSFRDPAGASQRVHDAIDALIAKHSANSRRTVAA